MKKISFSKDVLLVGLIVLFVLFLFQRTEYITEGVIRGELLIISFWFIVWGILMVIAELIYEEISEIIANRFFVIFFMICVGNLYFCSQGFLGICS